VSEPFAPELGGLSAWAARRRGAASGAFVLGIAGAQGSGKSTLAGLVALQLAREHGLRTAVLSLDDLYLTRAEREQLARDVHPLLRTRGVPGTHDVALGLSLIAALRTAGPEPVRVPVPRFDKGSDDRLPPERWAEVNGAIDVLIFEGWCLGARPESEDALAAPINALERDEDPDGRFRRHVNAQLAGPYAALFAAIDALVFLAAPDLQCSLVWRTQQERELAAHAPGRAVMSDAELARFVQHYERISRHMLAELPARADALLRLDRGHRCAAMTLRKPAR
jgi:D-glycerate 3-kinase